MFKSSLFSSIGVFCLCSYSIGYCENWEDVESFEAVHEARKNWIEEADLYSSPAYLELLDKSEDVLDSSKMVSVALKNQRAKSEFPSQLVQSYGARSNFLPPQQRIENGRNYDRFETKQFLSLALNEDDEWALRNFIIRLDTRSIEELMTDRDGLESIKQRLDSLHPLRLAGFIFSDPTTVAHARNIMNSDVKVSLFVILMQIEIQAAKDNGTLDRYLPGFIDYLGLHSATVWNYLNNSNYEGLIRYLLKM